MKFEENQWEMERKHTEKERLEETHKNESEQMKTVRKDKKWKKEPIKGRYWSGP